MNEQQLLCVLIIADALLFLLIGRRMWLNTTARWQEELDALDARDAAERAAFVKYRAVMERFIAGEVTVAEADAEYLVFMRTCYPEGEAP